ncbi:uncharacterized protein B0H18DRAFT_960574 [Fomitopsis serialis]|uniref:uncharacterized protein n=1 Tax=Fomitopsis serialis TaxID=139415 RepID=UPI002007B86E|nr:uncharacterized protein B0H18DRAFT_960574 [Neoantrodia serialis]KAH9913171.1 hypothetical protein B0H18DRAFT_960574 [Neoantrodia serialis]
MFQDLDISDFGLNNAAEISALFQFESLPEPDFDSRSGDSNHLWDSDGFMKEVDIGERGLPEPVVFNSTGDSNDEVERVHQTDPAPSPSIGAESLSTPSLTTTSPSSESSASPVSTPPLLYFPQPPSPLPSPPSPTQPPPPVSRRSASRDTPAARKVVPLPRQSRSAARKQPQRQEGAIVGARTGRDQAPAISSQPQPEASSSRVTLDNHAETVTSFPGTTTTRPSIHPYSLPPVSAHKSHTTTYYTGTQALAAPMRPAFEIPVREDQVETRQGYRAFSVAASASSARSEDGGAPGITTPSAPILDGTFVHTFVRSAPPQPYIQPYTSSAWTSSYVPADSLAFSASTPGQKRRRGSEADEDGDTRPDRHLTNPEPRHDPCSNSR